MKSGVQANLCRIQFIKCVIVGDEMVGKSCLLNSFIEGAFYKESHRTIFDIYPTTVLIDDNPVAIDLWDTSGIDQYDNYRYGIYPQTDVFLMCFSLEDRLSLNNIKTHWNREVRSHCPNTPIILVGTQLDLREDDVLGISYKEGLSMAKKVKAIKYMECSALAGTGLNDLFLKAFKVALKNKNKRNTLNCPFM